MQLSLVLSSIALAHRAYAGCVPTPAFPVPSWSAPDAVFADALYPLEDELNRILSGYDIASVSIELTSSTETLWEWHHTARKQNAERPGTSKVDGDSYYRIASITKAFTTLAILQQHAAGNLSINDPVDKYIPELAGDKGGDLPWKDITLRAMASQLSGIPREFGQSDFLGTLEEPWQYGFPPESQATLPHCFWRNSSDVCSRAELLEFAKTYEPLFAPNQQSTYSNLNFELLGLVIENVSGQSYEDYLKKAIFDKLDLRSTTLTKPSDKHAVIPDDENAWDWTLGSLSPTGGIYSTTSDLSKFLRYTLTHYNALVTGINWLHPASFSTSVQSTYGMPWEIFRTDEILDSRRAVTFVTKSGGLPSYFSIIISLPEYGLGLTMLVGGPSEVLSEVREAVTTDVVRQAEKIIWYDMKGRYAGLYVSADDKLNSTFAVSVSAATGIKVDTWISNSTDVLKYFSQEFSKSDEPPKAGHAQLIPTLLYKDEKNQQGEIFRLVFVPEAAHGPKKVWDSFCINDVDTPGTYAGRASNEVVFWHDKAEVELPAFRVRLKLQKPHFAHDSSQSLLFRSETA